MYTLVKDNLDAQAHIICAIVHDKYCMNTLRDMIQATSTFKLGSIYIWIRSFLGLKVVCREDEPLEYMSLCCYQITTYL